MSQLGKEPVSDNEVQREQYELPLLCVKRTILFPIDVDNHSEIVFDYFLKHMLRPGDYVIFINIVQPMYHRSVYGIPEAPCLVNDKFSPSMDKEIERSKKLCKVFMRKARKSKIMYKSYIRVNSSQGEALVTASKDYHANLIVMPSCESGLLRKAFLGSVDQYLIQNAHLPIVIITKDHQVQEYDAKGNKLNEPNHKEANIKPA